MTIATGLLGKGGVVICADSQELIGNYGKSETDKIKTFELPGGNWRFSFAAAADDGDYADMLYQELFMELANIETFDYMKIEGVIKSRLHQLHRKHIWPQGKDHPLLSALVVLQDCSPNSWGTALLRLSKTSVVRVDRYASVGAGTYMADYLYRRHVKKNTDKWLTPVEQIAYLAIFMLKEIKFSVQGCDGETHIGIFRNNGGLRLFTTHEVRQIEGCFDDMQSAMGLITSAISNTVAAEDAFNENVSAFVDRIQIVRQGQLTAKAKLDKERKRYDTEIQNTKDAK